MSDPDKTSVANVAPLEVQGTVACLCVVAGTDVGRVFELRRGETTIGRGETADIRIEDDGVSRHHAKVTLLPGEPPRVYDLGSTNGTFVNGDLVTLHPLREGDHLQIGRRTVMLFRRERASGGAAQQRLYEEATRDASTGLHNVRYFRERLHAEFSYAARTGEAIAVIAVEVIAREPGVDRDEVSRKAAAALGAAVRTEDVCAQTAALSFAVLSRDGEPGAARAFAGRLLRVIGEATGRHAGVRAVAGAAIFDRAENRAPEDLWRTAEARLSIARGGAHETIEGP
jgi:GGDEF domain-containing protein